MARLRFSLPAASFVLLLSASSVMAQAAVVRPAAQLVSPGAARRPALAAACPVFSWAPVEGAPGYELAVHEWLGGELGNEPVMRTTLPGRSASWTPAASNCLRTGVTYLWFIRETTEVGEPVGAWSSGLAFRVADPVDTAAETRDARAGGGDVAGATQPAEKPPVNDNPNGNPIQDQLTAINAKLDDLLSPFSWDVCAELGIEGEVHQEFGGDINGTFDGSVGAKAFGNGVKGKIEAKPSWSFGAQVQIGIAPKTTFCFDLLSLFQGGANATRTRFANKAAAAGLSAIDTNALTDRLLAVAGQLNLNGDRLTKAIDFLPDVTTDVDPWSAFRSDGPVSRLADVLPVPGKLVETLKDPAQIIANFKSQLALCANNNLPPAVAGVIDEFCTLASKERFSKLLDRVDGAVTNVSKTVDDILGQLPTGGDCKFFCKN